MSRVTIITSSYYPETCAPAKRFFAFARILKAHGFDVTVIAPLPNYPQGKVYDGYEKRLIQESNEEGIRVIRLLPIIAPKDKLVLRLIAEIASASLTAFAYLTRTPADLVFASSPAIFLGPFGMAVAKLTRAKFVWDVRDLLWRYTQAVGETRFKRFAGDLIESLMVYTAHQAELLTATTESQQQYFINHGVDPTKTALMPNGIPSSFFEAMSGEPSETNEENPFRVVYAGLIGYPQGLGTLISAAKLLQADSSIEVVIAGEGVERAGLMKRCEEEVIGNVRFPGYLSQPQLQELYRSADILYAQLRGEPVFASAQPSKVWEYLAAGKPVVYGGLGEAVASVERSEGGVTIPPDDPIALAETLMRLAKDPERLREMATKGRAFAQANLRQEDIFGKTAQKLAHLVGLLTEFVTVETPPTPESAPSR